MTTRPLAGLRIPTSRPNIPLVDNQKCKHSKTNQTQWVTQPDPSKSLLYYTIQTFRWQLKDSRVKQANSVRSTMVTDINQYHTTKTNSCGNMLRKPAHKPLRTITNHQSLTGRNIPNRETLTAYASIYPEAKHVTCWQIPLCCTLRVHSHRRIITA